MKQPLIKFIPVILAAALSACGPTAEQLVATFVAETATAASLSEVDVESDITTADSTDATLPETDTEQSTVVTSESADTPLVVDLTTALKNGTIDLVIANGTGDLGGSVDFVVRNSSDTALLLEWTSGLLIGDDNPTTVDLVLPSVTDIELSPGSEVSLTIPAYQAAYQLQDPGSEPEEEDFINPTPPAYIPLFVQGVDARLGAVLDAAEVSDLSEFDLAAQFAVLAIASDIRSTNIGVCGYVMVFTGNINFGDKSWYSMCLEDFTLGFTDKRDPSTGMYTGLIEDAEFDKLVGEARDILRIAVGLNADLATPFRIVFKQTSALLSDEQVRSALVALVDQDRIVEFYGFGVTFHLLSSGQIPEGGAATLPEITTGEMSQSDAVAVIEEWTSANDSYELELQIDGGDPMFLLPEILQSIWYDAGVSMMIYLDDFESHSINFVTADFKDASMEHRPGLLP